jgi:uncharacterized RDD family membrane protein YckC
MDRSVAPGFHSAASKRAVTRALWTGGILVGLLQLVVPAALVIWAFVSAIFGVFTTPQPDFESPAVLDGHVYYTTKALVNGEDSSEDTPRSLVRVPLDRDGAPEVVAEVGADFSEPKLVTAQGVLHLIETDRVTTVRDGATSSVEVEDSLPYQFWPLGHDDTPTVVTLRHDYDTDRDKVELRTWDGAQWNVVRSASTTVPVDEDELRAVVIGAVIHVFVSGYEEPIFHAEFTDLGLSPWESTQIRADTWTVATQGEAPVLLPLDTDVEPATIVAWRQSAGWRRAFAQPAGTATSIGAATLANDRVAVFTDGLFDGLVVQQFEGKSKVSEREHTASTIWEETIGLVVVSQIAPFLLTGLLAVIVASRMQRHRVLEFRGGERVVRYASLTRRGVARAIDTALTAALPLAVILPRVLSDELDDVTIAALALGLSLPALVGLCVMEGTLGYSVGKKLAGIRVVDMSLNRCGVGPAFTRNVLGIVDGMFNYLVGIALVATHEHWQRLGDRVSNTLVIEADS